MTGKRQNMNGYKRRKYLWKSWTQNFICGEADKSGIDSFNFLKNEFQ